LPTVPTKVGKFKAHLSKVVARLISGVLVGAEHVDSIPSATRGYAKEFV
jgi:hypothetical protein